MIWEADAKEAKKRVDELVKEGIEPQDAIDIVARSEVCNCGRPMVLMGNLWTCVCGNRRFQES